jgi:hypothetical protein
MEMVPIIILKKMSNRLQDCCIEKRTGHAGYILESVMMMTMIVMLF